MRIAWSSLAKTLVEGKFHHRNLHLANSPTWAKCRCLFATWGWQCVVILIRHNGSSPKMIHLFFATLQVVQWFPWSIHHLQCG